MDCLIVDEYGARSGTNEEECRGKLDFGESEGCKANMTAFLLGMPTALGQHN